MPRDFNINGETLVKVKFGAHIPNAVSNISGSMSNLSELGLAAREVRIVPKLVHQNINADDFGPEVPAELMGMLAECRIFMTLIHYDESILDFCWSESLGNSFTLTAINLMGPPTIVNTPGTVPGAGSLIGNGLPLQASGNHYISLNLSSPVLNKPWRFPASVLTGFFPMRSLGTRATPVDIEFRAIPYKFPVAIYAPEVVSSGTVLFDHTLDT